MKSILFTKEGFDKINKDLKKAEDKRPEVLKSLVRAREMGDLSENGAYKSAKFELSNLDRKIRHLKRLISQAEVVIPKDNKTVQIGHKVTLRRIA